MKNKEITMYELIGLVKDDKTPKRIKYQYTIYEYDKNINGYFNKDGYNLFYLVMNRHILNDNVEILPEENDEWEDIPIFKISDYKEIFNQFQLDIFKQINLIKKNQKYLKERLDKDENCKSW